MKNRWIIAFLTVFTSCGGYNDNPVKPVQNQDRQYFETAISKALDETSKDVRLDVGKDVTACMNALREIHNLAGSNPDFYTVDTYTQQLNDYLDFSISQKGHATKARSSLITCKADGEYLPHIALQFPNESAPMAIYDRFSKKDKQNYRHFADQVNALGKEARNLIGVVRNKIQVVKDLE